MIKNAYDMIMDPEQNPLSALPKVVKFRYMVILAYMWSLVFAFWTGYIALFGPSAIAHTIILLGFFFTADIFRRARRQGVSHRDAMRDPRDGTVLYDDVWGAP